MDGTAELDDSTARAQRSMEVAKISLLPQAMQALRNGKEVRSARPRRLMCRNPIGVEIVQFTDGCVYCRAAPIRTTGRRPHSHRTRSCGGELGKGYTIACWN